MFPAKHHLLIPLNRVRGRLDLAKRNKLSQRRLRRYLKLFTIQHNFHVTNYRDYPATHQIIEDKFQYTHCTPPWYRARQEALPTHSTNRYARTKKNFQG